MIVFLGSLVLTVCVCGVYVVALALWHDYRDACACGLSPKFKQFAVDWLRHL